MPEAVVAALQSPPASQPGAAKFRAGLLAALWLDDLAEPSRPAAQCIVAKLAADDSSALVRVAAIEALVRVDLAEPATLIAALGDPAPAVRVSAAQALRGRHRKIAAFSVRAAFRAETDETARVALFATLADWGDVKDLGSVCNALTDSSLRLVALDSFAYAFRLADLLPPEEDAPAAGMQRWLAQLRQSLVRLRLSPVQRLAMRGAERISWIMLHDDNSACRAAAARALRFCPGMVPAFARALADDDDAVLEEVFVGLEMQKDTRRALPALIDCYERHPQWRQDICDVIKRQDHDAAAAFLSDAYRHASDGKLRLEIVDGRVGHPLPVATPMLLAALADAEVEIRCVAARRLRDVAYWDAADPEAFKKTLSQALVETMAIENEPSVRIEILHSLRELGSVENLPDLLAALAACGDEAVRTAIVEAVAEIAPHAAEAVLVELARASQDASRHAAADGLARIGNAAAMPSLLERIADPRMPRADRAELIENLGRAGKALAEPALLALLDDPSPCCAAAAASGLGHCPTPVAIAALVRCLGLPSDESIDDDVRVNALNALAELGAREALHAIEAYLDDASSRYRLHALRAYASILGSAAGATLERALDDESETIREDAALMLAALEEGESGGFHRWGLACYE